MDIQGTNLFKKNILLIFALLFTHLGFAQNIELLGDFSEIKLKRSPIERYSPTGIMIDELNQNFLIYDEIDNTTFVYNIPLDQLGIDGSFPEFRGPSYKINNYIFSGRANWIQIKEDDSTNFSKADRQIISSGICFLIKDNSHNIFVFTTNKYGAVTAIDTDGVLYTQSEALDILKLCDIEKYNETIENAQRYGIRNEFTQGKVLFWGETYYGSPKKLNTRFNQNKFPALSNPVYSDSDGNYYHMFIQTSPASSSELTVHNSNGDLIEKFIVSDNSAILRGDLTGSLVSDEIIIGFGGNIYYYISSEDFTELFRIRRTWGEPNHYSLAINGYTDDSYGEYVIDTLNNMSKTELESVKNHMYALYGYVFSEKDINNYFEKQVWYNGTSDYKKPLKDLPANRRKLIEIINVLLEKHTHS